MSKVIHIIEKKEFDNLLLNNKYVVVDFFAQWCGPCKQLAPQYEKLASTYGDKIKFCKIDTDESEDLASLCKIKSMPTIRIYQDANNIDNVIGADIKRLTEIVKNIYSSL